MRAMVLERPGRRLRLVEGQTPHPPPGRLLVRVAACGVCRTDQHVVDGDLKNPRLPVVPGHEIVGYVEAIGAGVEGFGLAQRVGVPWLGSTCGSCHYCKTGHENLCDHPGFTGYTIDGGFADYTIADARYCFSLDVDMPDAEAAPLMCAGLIGYRSLRFAGGAKSIGIYGFGAAAHIITQVATWQGCRIFAFTRPEDTAAQELAKSVGAMWCGGSDEPAPEPLDAAIIFAPVGSLVPVALKSVAKGGTVVLGGIHMSDIPSMPYEILWGERRLCSVANLTRQDATDFLALASRIPLKVQVKTMALQEANSALDEMRTGKLTGAAVLVPSSTDKFEALT